MQGIGTASRDVARVQSRGRFGDTRLAHLSPKARATLRGMGSSGARNPETGLEEHWSFKDLLPILAPVALNFLAPGVGSGIGEALGLSGTAANMVGGALAGGGIGALTGGGRGALTGALTGGALAGFNEAGGFKGIGNALGIGGADASGAAAGAAPAGGADSLGIEPTPEPAVGGVPLMQGVEPEAMGPRGLAVLAQDVPLSPSEMGQEAVASGLLPPPPTMAPRTTAPSTRGAGGVAEGSTFDKYKTPLLIGGGLLALQGLGDAPKQGDDEMAMPVASDFGGPLPKYEMDRGNFTPLSDAELRMFGLQGRSQPAGTGIFYEAPNRFKKLAEGGKVSAAPSNDDKWRPFEEYDKFRKPGAWRGDEVKPNNKPASSVRKAAERLSDLGRNGDTKLAHINPEEEQILLALGGSGTINPNTGLREYYDSEPGEGSAGSGTTGGAANDGGGGSDPMGTGADYGGDRTGQRSDLGMGPSGDYAEDAQAAQYSPRSLPQKAYDYVSTNVRDKIQDIKENPVKNAIDFALGFTPVGLINTLAGALGIGTLGGAATAAGRAVSGYDGPQTGMSAGSQPTGPQGPQSSPDGGDFYIPAPTMQIAQAPPATQIGGGSGGGPSITPSWQRNMSIPSDEALRNFGLGGQQQTPGGLFYDTPNMTHMQDGGDVSDGRSDDVPAMLSTGEHVLDAELVALAGNGSNEAGHARIEKWKADLRKQKGKALAKGKISPNAKLPRVA